MSTPPRIAVVDYGAGNLKSVAKALLRSGLAPEVTADPASVRAAQAVVLPGVGAFADTMANLRERGLADAVLASIEAGRPYLGICLGLQVLFEESDEHGRNPGLGLLPGRKAAGAVIPGGVGLILGFVVVELTRRFQPDQWQGRLSHNGCSIFRPFYPTFRQHLVVVAISYLPGLLKIRFTIHLGHTDT